MSVWYYSFRKFLSFELKIWNNVDDFRERTMTQNYLKFNVVARDTIFALEWGIERKIRNT